MSHCTPSTAAAAAVLLVCGAADATTVKQFAGPVQQVLTANDKTAQSTQTPCSSGFSNVRGASFKVTLPPGASQLLTARFDADVGISPPSSGFSANFIRILAGGRTMRPGDDAILENGAASILLTPRMLERSIVLAPGTYNVVVQYCPYSSTGDSSVKASVGNWQLTVEAAPVQ